ncbi:dUTPase-like protein [Ustulina deusta]|nr:dUTPase-like protein [Ustulina deusta]KAI3335150.1 dUTPase-like protein [Ustulina deusta]
MFSGSSVVKHGIVRKIRAIIPQTRPCGVDLSLQRVLKWTSPATIDFDYSSRQPAATSELSFDGEPETISLAPGAYLVEFHETCFIPLNCSGQIFAGAALWRAGAVLTAGVVEPGYQGVLGALLDVKNPAGIVVHKNARLGQIVFQRIAEKRPWDGGTSQHPPDIPGSDGPTAKKRNYGKYRKPKMGETGQLE